MPITRVLGPDGEPLDRFSIEAVSPDGGGLLVRTFGDSQRYFLVDPLTASIEPALQDQPYEFFDPIALSNDSLIAGLADFRFDSVELSGERVAELAIVDPDGTPLAEIDPGDGLRPESVLFLGEDRVAFTLSPRFSGVPSPEYDVEVRDLATGETVTVDVGAPGGSSASVIDASADGEVILVQALAEGGGNGLFVYDTTSGTSQELPDDINPRSFRSDNGALQLSGNGSEVLFEDADFRQGVTTISAFDLATGEVSELAEVGDRYASFAASEDGRFLAVAPPRFNDPALPQPFDFEVVDRQAGESFTIALDAFDQRSYANVRSVVVGPDGSPTVAFSVSGRDSENGFTSGLFTADLDLIANPDEASTAAGQPVTIDVLANDVDFGDDGLRIAAVTVPETGSLTIDSRGTGDRADDSLVYTPNPGFAGEERFAYTVRDGAGNEDEAEIVVLVQGEPSDQPFVVTTADGAVDPNDGELSLREAVAAANLAEGEDTILFADGIDEVELSVEGGGLVITNDLVIDGDLGDGGAEAVRLVWQIPEGQYDNLPPAAFAVDGVGLRLEDLTLTSAEGYGPEAGIYARGANVEVVRSEISGLGSYSRNTGIDAEGGSLLIQDSMLSDFNFGDFGGGTAVRTQGVSTRIEGSEFSGGAFLMRLDGETDIERSVFYGENGVETGTYIIEVRGNARIADSTIANAITEIGYGAAGIEVFGNLDLVNSTVNRVGSFDDSYSYVAGVQVFEGGYARIVNSTIAGVSLDLDKDREGEAVGLGVREGGQAYVANSIVAGNYLGGERSDVSGDFTSGGGNVFGQEVVEGAIASDVTGAAVTELFANLRLEDRDDFDDDLSTSVETFAFRPVVADNGGPTPTIALVQNPDNPAVGAADPSAAPATDQRGSPRDAEPDAGAFELQPDEAAPETEVLLVTTGEDTVDPDDGLLSLREALELANARPGLDAIVFSTGVRAAGVDLDAGLEVTDALVLDGGDTGESTTIRLDPASGDALLTLLPFERVGYGASGFFVEDLALDGGRGPAIDAQGVDVQLLRTDVGGVENPDGRAVGVLVEAGADYGPTLTVLDSRIGGNAGATAYGVIAEGGRVEIGRSTVEGNVGDVFGAGIFAEGASLDVARSTIAENGGGEGGAGTIFAEDGFSRFQDSTVARNFAGDGDDPRSGGVVVLEGSDPNREFPRASFDNVTVAGNEGAPGLRVADGARLSLRDSVVAGNEGPDVLGTIESGGSNVFGQRAVEGAAPQDVTGVPAGRLFAEVGEDGLPVLADNGGPTETVALSDSVFNPAIDLAGFGFEDEDQRGVEAIGPRDAGAFEVGTRDPVFLPDGLPNLGEKVAVDPSRVNSVPEAAVTAGVRGDAEITFLGGEAEQTNVLGYVVVDANGRFGEAGVLIDDTTDRFLEPGDELRSVRLEQGESLQLFVVADGADLNEPDLFDFRSEFVLFGGAGSTRPQLFSRDEGSFNRPPGPLERVEGQVLFATDLTPDTPGNRLNPQDAVRTLSGVSEGGNLLVAFEDKPFDPDNDFNDLVLEVDIPGFRGVTFDEFV